MIEEIAKNIFVKLDYEGANVGCVLTNEGAIVIDIYNKSFKDEISKLDKEKKYFVYCKTGIRSRSAVSYMVNSGFKNVCDLEGGINYLSRAGAKIVK